MGHRVPLDWKRPRGRPRTTWSDQLKKDGETSIDTLDPGSGQIAVEEGRDGLAGLHDLVVVVVVCEWKMLAGYWLVAALFVWLRQGGEGRRSTGRSLRMKSPISSSTQASSIPHSLYIIRILSVVELLVILLGGLVGFKKIL